MQHLQQANNIRPMSGELSGSLGGTGTFGSLTALAIAGVAYGFIKKEDWAPLAGAFLQGTSLEVALCTLIPITQTKVEQHGTSKFRTISKHTRIQSSRKHGETRLHLKKEPTTSWWIPLKE